MSRYSSFKKLQLMAESFRKFLKEDEGGVYSIKHGSYGVSGFYGPDGKELLDADEYELGTSDILAAVEDLPAFAQIIDKEAFEAHKQRERAQGREEGPGLYPEPDMLDRYVVGDLYGRDMWDALFKLYLTAAGVSNPQVGEYVAPDDDDDDYDY